MCTQRATDAGDELYARNANHCAPLPARLGGGNQTNGSLPKRIRFAHFRYRSRDEWEKMFDQRSFSSRSLTSLVAASTGEKNTSLAFLAGSLSEKTGWRLQSEFELRGNEAGGGGGGETQGENALPEFPVKIMATHLSVRRTAKGPDVRVVRASGVQPGGGGKGLAEEHSH